ncbi:hypothetical protein MUU72_03170 [Streptomyces sp. RS10V-4]|uniref:hypothetical protein n=1 Tax=Streptomyces rhizoryzae TaxID=2932493 RepID=UPI002004661F|nr:hypothetical protein [Streptomyces rhizoryzae]MCK7622135.1 hypothetical protein [Streptomyces rhizoryzae]
MGWTILYIAFGLVALWLLGEVLFQHKARLRWRALALAGFLGVVTGVIIPSVIVVALGAIAFATGQTYVTLSVRRGFAEGWTLGRRPKVNRRRRARPSRGAGPKLQVSGLSEEHPAGGTGPEAPAPAADHPAPAGHGADGAAGHDAYPPQPVPAPGQPAAAGEDFGYAFADAPTVYAPQPLPDETGAYGVYSPDARADRTAAPVSYDLFGNVTTDGDPGGYADGHGHAPGNDYGYGGGYAGQTGHDGYGGHGGHADPYPAYGDGSYQGAQAPYSDPYIGTQQYAAPYDPYEEQDPFGRAPYAADPLQGPDGQHAQHTQHYDAQGYHPGTGPDGVWVPQQRDTGHPAADQQPPYPPQPGYDGQRYPY